MIHKWMKKLMPKEDQFIVLFEKQGNCLKKSARFKKLFKFTEI